MKKHKVILNHDTRPSWMIREEKIKRRIRFGPPPYVLNNANRLTRWNANISVMERGEKGDIQTLICASCNAVKPYYEFYADYNGSLYGRTCRCIDCSKVWRENKKSVNKKTAKSFATHLTKVIKRDLHFRNKRFQTLIKKEIWEALGYTEEQYIEHFLNLMESWMNWENNRKPEFPGDKTWDVEHVKPKSLFDYKSIHDAQFKQAWALSNMIPMPTQMNAVKSNFESVNEKIRYLYKKYVIENNPDKNGTWCKYFDFSPLAAREHLEANFCEGMTFDNHGDVWHIDHVIPLAAMPFDSLEDENFKKVWHYTNLSPKFIKDNLAKGSKHEKIKHFTQKI